MMELKTYLATLMLIFTVPASASYDVWNQKANYGGTARHRCTSFAIGNKGYIGLGHINAISNILYADFWEYDPSTNSWTQKADFGGGPRYHSYGFSYGNKGYVGTGREQDGDYTDDLWEFDPVANTWTQKTDIPGPKRRGAVCFVVDGVAYVGTGEIQGAGFSNEFYAYDIAADTWSAIAMFPGPERTSAVAFSIDDKGYVGTGGMVSGMNDFWEYKPATDQWTQRANVGPTPRQEAVGFSVNGKGYIGTGDQFSNDDNFGDMWEYDPAENAWIQIEDFGGLPRRYLSAFVIGSKVYAGVGTNGTNFRDFWEFDQLLSAEQHAALASIRIYPNPVIDYITIDPGDFKEDNLNFSLYKTNGSLVYAAPLNEHEVTLERGDLAAGNYFYLLSSPRRVIKSGQLIFE